jgi:hypothetical protein
MEGGGPEVQEQAAVPAEELLGAAPPGKRGDAEPAERAEGYGGEGGDTAGEAAAPSPQQQQQERELGQPEEAGAEAARSLAPSLPRQARTRMRLRTGACLRHKYSSCSPGANSWARTTA